MKLKSFVVLLALIVCIEPVFAKDTTSDWFQTGEKYYKKKQYKSAIHAFSKALDQAPDNSIYHNWRGYTYYLAGDAQKAVDDFNQAIALTKNSVNMFQNRGLAYYRLRKYKQALVDFNRAMELDRGYRKGSLFYFRGRVYSALKDNMHAIGDFTTALRYGNKQKYSLYVRRGFAYSNIHHNDKALQDYSSAQKIAPNAPLAYLYKGALLYLMKRYSAAEENLARVLARYPQNGEANIYMGLIDLIMGRYQNAEERFNKSRHSKKDKVESLYNLAVLYMVTGKSKRCEALVRDSRKSFDTDKVILAYADILRYFNLLKQKETKRARAVLEKAERENSSPNTASALLSYLRGDISADELLFAKERDETYRTTRRAVIGLNNLYSGRTISATKHLGWVVHRGKTAPFFIQALLAYRNLVAEDPRLSDVVVASVYFEPEAVQKGYWGHLVAEFIPFPGHTTVGESWSISSPGGILPEMEKKYTVSLVDHRQVIDYKIPQEVESGIYQIRMTISLGTKTYHDSSDFEVR